MSIPLRLGPVLAKVPSCRALLKTASCQALMNSNESSDEMNSSFLVKSIDHHHHCQLQAYLYQLYLLLPQLVDESAERSYSQLHQSIDRLHCPMLLLLADQPGSPRKKIEFSETSWDQDEDDAVLLLLPWQQLVASLVQFLFE